MASPHGAAVRPVTANLTNATDDTAAAVRVMTVDTSGSYAAAGGGTQYTEGDTDTTITGTAALAEAAGNTLTPLQVDGSGNLNVNVAAGSASGTEYTEGATDATITGTAVLAEGPADALTPLLVDASQLLQVDIAADSVGIGGGIQYTEGDTDASITGVAVMWEDAADTLRSVSAAKPLPVGDAGGSLTVDGTVAVSSVGGTVTVDASGTAVPITDNAGSITVDGTVTADAGTGPWPVTDNGSSLTVDGTVAVSSVGGTVTVDLGANNDVTVTSGTITTITNVVHVDDNSGSLTVDGSVSASQSGTWTVQPGNTANTTAWKVDASSVAVPVTDNSGSLTVDNAGTFAVQDSQVLADNAGFTDGTSKVFMSGFIFDETAGTALTENDAAAARIDSKRSLVGVIEDATTRGQRAAVFSNGQLVVAARPQYASAGAALTITLASLGATSARESTSVDNSSNLYKDALVLAVLKSNGVSANDTVAYVYVAGSSHDGSSDVWPDAVTGSDAAITLDSPTQLRLLGVVNFGAAGAAAATKKGGPWSVAAAFGGTMPKKWSIVIQNSNAALTATAGDHKVIYQGVNA